MTYLTPEQYTFLHPLKDNFEIILEEYKGVKNYVRLKWPEIELHNDKWTVFGLIGPGGQRDVENCSRCPKTMEIIDSIDVPYTAGYSFLEPGCQIYPHKGYTDDVIRVHLGLEVPITDCGIMVDNVSSTWKVGELLVFNDRSEHSAWNLTDKIRAVLLIDFPRDRFNV